MSYFSVRHRTKNLIRERVGIPDLTKKGLGFWGRLNLFLEHDRAINLFAGTYVMRASAASVLVSVLAPEHITISAAGGDLPASLGKKGNELIIQAAEGVSTRGGYEYTTQAKFRAKEAVSKYLGEVVPPTQIFLSGGLSSASREIAEKHEILSHSDIFSHVPFVGTGALAVHGACSHPLFYQDALFNMGKNSIREIRRLSDGTLDLDHLENILTQNKDRPILFSLVPYENPTGIIYSEDYLKKLFSILNKFRNITVYLDCMYHDFTYSEDGKTHITVQKLGKLAKEAKLPRVYMGIGLSKIMLSPGSRGAALAIFGESSTLDTILAYFDRWENSTINGGVSNNTIAALATAFSGDLKITESIEDTRMKVEKLVFPNRKTLVGEGTSPIYLPYPNARLQTAFYQFIGVGSDKWANEQFRKQQWDELVTKYIAPAIQRAEQVHTIAGWNTDRAARDLRRFIESRLLLSQLRGDPYPMLDVHEAFVWDLMQNKGISVAPGSLFYWYASPYLPNTLYGVETPLARVILSHEPHVYPKIVSAIKERS